MDSEDLKKREKKFSIQEKTILFQIEFSFNYVTNLGYKSVYCISYYDKVSISRVSGEWDTCSLSYFFKEI